MFKEKVVLVTGSSRGIGLKIALDFIDQGAVVIFNSRKRPVNFFKNYSIIKPYYYEADISNYEETKQMVDEIIEKFGKIDILINNAGIAEDKKLVNMHKEQWGKVLDTNLNSVFNCCKLITPHMINNRYGRIVNISSVIAQTGNYGQTNYSAAKAGIIRFTKSLALELSTKNITVNCVAPGFINTDMLEKIPDKIKKNIIESIPMKRLGSPSDISNAVTFLSNNNSHYITGQVISINGGLYM